MDPNQCLMFILEDMESGDRDGTIDNLENLLDWVKKGGFLPEVKHEGPRLWWIGSQKKGKK